MDRIVVTNTFSTDMSDDSSDTNDSTIDDETFYFDVIEEDDETSDSDDDIRQSTNNEIIDCNNISSLDQMEVDTLFSSISEDEDPANQEEESIENTESTVRLISRPGCVDISVIKFIEDQEDVYEEIFNELIIFLSDKQSEDFVHPLNKMSLGFPLQVKDLFTLVTPKSWLNDNVINNYTALLVKKCDNKHTLNMDTDFMRSIKLRGFDGVFKWFKKKDLKNTKVILFPFNINNNHWAVCVAEIWEGKLHYFNSIPNSDGEEYVTRLKNFISQAVIDYVEFSGVTKTAPKDWTIIKEDCPEQQNSYDCGVFLCMNARNFVLGRPVDYIQQCDIPIIRQIIAWELIGCTLGNF